MSFAEAMAAATAQNGTSINNDPEVRKALNGVGIDPDEIGNARHVWVKTERDDDGEQRLSGFSILLSPKWQDGPQWIPVQPADPVQVKVPKGKPVNCGDGWQTIVVLPDTQIGFRRYEDGTLDPFHDPAAMAAAVAVTEHVRPNKTVVLGDLIDMPEFGRFRHEPEFVGTINPSINVAHRFLAAASALSDETFLFQGNHDIRLRHYVTDNAKSANGIRRAGDPEGWPVLSLPYLVKLDELGIEYIDGYPAGKLFVDPWLVAQHGATVKSQGSTAEKLVREHNMSVIFGHVHRTELHYRTIATPAPGQRKPSKRLIAGYTPGCLCRIDGAVPGAKSGIDERGRPVLEWQNWQQGIGVVHHHPDHDIVIEHVPIVDGVARYRGRSFVGDVSLFDPSPWQR